jgi:hypothetical protein
MPELKDILPELLDSHRNSTKPEDLDNASWHYFLALEADFNNSIRFVDLVEENDATFSIEFARQLVCISTEFETIAKQLCTLVDNSKPAGNISHYKEIILTKYPEMYEAPVYVDRYKRTLFPFSNWNQVGGRLEWWDAYQHIKHHRQDYFSEATIKNVLYALASLLILELYLYGTINPSCKNRKGGAILLRSPGMVELMYVQPEEDLPHLPKRI